MIQVMFIIGTVTNVIKEVVLPIMAFYTMLLLIKALNVYLHKNS